MTLQEYQDKAIFFLNNKIIESGRDEMLNLAALGLSGEAGQFSDAWKKIHYHDHELKSHQLSLELGDILWYICVAANALGYTLENIAENNIVKLSNRYPNGWDKQKSINRQN